MSAMETCRLSTVLLLAYIGLSSVVLEAQVRVKPQVTGYLGDEVTLHCELLQGNLTQAEWQWERLDGKKIFIAVFSPKFGQNISGSPLKERLKFTGASTGDPSITIKDVAMTDAGNYTCSLTAFPSGSIAKTTILTVLDQTPPSSGEVAWIVTAAVVLTVVVTATAYLIIVRKRREALFNPSVNIDVSSLVVNADRRGREEDMVYSEIVRFNIVKSKAHNPCGGDQKDADVKPAENATYSAVAVGNQHPFGEETVYSQVVRKDWDIDDVWTV